MRTINCYNRYHLGDCTYQMVFFRNLLKRTKLDLVFNFYVNSGHITELYKQVGIYGDRINILPISNCPNDAVDVWIGKYGWHDFHPTYDGFNLLLFSSICETMGIPNHFLTIDDVTFNDDVLREFDTKYKTTHDEYDYLFINSRPFSGQYSMQDLRKFDELIINDYIGKKIITTKPILSIESTINYGFNLMQIGNLSLRCKNIIGIHTAPIIPTLNSHTRDNCDKIIMMQYKGLSYSFDNCVNVRNHEELLKIL